MTKRASIEIMAFAALVTLGACSKERGNADTAATTGAAGATGTSGGDIGTPAGGAMRTDSAAGAAGAPATALADSIRRDSLHRDSVAKGLIKGSKSAKKRR